MAVLVYRMIFVLKYLHISLLRDAHRPWVNETKIDTLDAIFLFRVQLSCFLSRPYD